jgi:ribonucleoside-diphosphate reductase alpha chain
MYLPKCLDRYISVNTSYNPEHYEDEKIPMSVLLQHVIMFYKYGGKQLYYNNTYDGQGEIEVTDLPELEQVAIDDDDCESCKI